jgi:2-methylisocitrate lyase-like PEP mutase family enzyme
MTMENTFRRVRDYGKSLQQRLDEDSILPLIGVYDVFSATLAARHFDAVFCSGYGLSASYYGLPDEGYIAWTDVVAWVTRIRHVLPETHIVVDIDDGYGDINTAMNAVQRLNAIGASGVIFEDQKRPKKCGHLEGKAIIPLHEYVSRLKKLIEVKGSLVMVARTDASSISEGLDRAEAFAEAGAECVLVEGIKDAEQIRLIRERVGDGTKILVNLIAGGKTKPISLTELHDYGVDIVNYSTPCLYSAHHAIETALKNLTEDDGRLEADPSIGLTENNGVLVENLDLAFSYTNGSSGTQPPERKTIPASREASRTGRYATTAAPR